ncbi:MAG: carbohydrate binding family 9 domain-containing protein [Gemmatimonadetes bacterium]|nr:carbohydrate binding family 9 domain-containing protein [Gemmatimonadota bacterium]
MKFAPILLLLGSLPVPVGATPQEALEIARLTGPITLDGRSDEQAWQAVDPVPFMMFQPVHGGAPSEHTEARFAYDSDAFYASARFYDSEPAGMRATTLKRDILNWANDYFCFLLDTFNDKENALGFCTTPAGVRLEYAVQGDVSGPNPVNEDWNTYWDVGVVRDETGWFAEIRVPWSSLRFQPEGDRVHMGLTTFRLIARKSELSVFPVVPARWGTVGVNKPSQMHPIVLEGVRSRRPLYIAPYALGGLGQSFALDTAGTAYARRDDPARELGVDFKYGVTSNLTLDLTYNTDFAQVEADDQQVNLTRFSLVFPEKRQFFQERASNFEFSTGDFDRVFYTRRIGLAGTERVPLHGGARLVGRLGAWDIGALSMQSAAGPAFPSENFGVVRLRRRALNENSYAGAIVTSRVGPGGDHNLVYGADAILRVAGGDYLTLQWVQTLDDGDTEAFRNLRTGLARLGWERRAVEGLGHNTGVVWIGTDYNPGLGYVQRRGVTRLDQRTAYGRRAPDSSGVLRQTWAVGGSAALADIGRSPESWEIGPEWRLEMKSRADLQVVARTVFDQIESPFQLSATAHVPAGSYTFHEIGARYKMADARRLRTTIDARGGTFYDGTRVIAMIRPTWSISRHIDLEAAYQYNRVDFPERGEYLRAHIGRVRAEAMLNTRVSGAVFVQYNRAVDGVITNVRLRFNPREGHDLFMVYNHGINTDRDRLEPMLPFTDARTVLIKYTRTFDLGF